VFGDPEPIAIRIFSTVGRSPVRSRTSAAWLTSLMSARATTTLRNKAVREGDFYYLRA
jgi:hypothetical protein